MRAPLPTPTSKLRRARPRRSKPDVLGDQAKIDATALSTARQKSIELLYDYTKFHIGVYLTIGGVYLTAAFATIDKQPVLPLNLYLLVAAIFFTSIAGFSGGVIVSSVTQSEAGSANAFLESKIGPWGFKRLRRRARSWTYWEHTTFWIGLLCAGLSFVPNRMWAGIGVGFMERGYREAPQVICGPRPSGQGDRGAATLVGSADAIGAGRSGCAAQAKPTD